jgi:hypothetical protein
VPGNDRSGHAHPVHERLHIARAQISSGSLSLTGSNEAYESVTP